MQLFGPPRQLLLTGQPWNPQVSRRVQRIRRERSLDMEDPMRASTNRLRLLPPAAAALVLAACANPPVGPAHADGAPADGAPAAPYRGAITRTVDYADLPIVLDIPHAQPKVPWQTVYKNCASSRGTCDPAGAPTIDLAVVTTPNSGHANPDGSIAPLLDHRLAYVFTWHGLPCVSTGGGIRPANSTAAPASVTPSKCTRIVLADATTGAFVYETDSSGDKY
jgi:hypothetical protein